MKKVAPSEVPIERLEKNVTTPHIAMGIFFVIAATIIFSCQDAITKTLVKDYPATFIVMVRYWVFFLVGSYMVHKADGGLKKNIKTKRPFIQFWRGVLLLLELLAVAIGFKTLGLAELTALFQSYPLFGTIFAIFLLKEAVGWRRILALVVGFIGILIMLRPGSAVFSVGAFWALAGAICYALYLALTRLVSTVDKPQTSFFYVGLVGFVLTTSGLPFFWVTMHPSHIWLIVLICCTSVAGHFFMIKALSLAPLTVIQPFNYLQLVWSVILGMIVFGDVPDLYTFVGAFLIVSSGLFVFFRERVKAKRALKTEVA